MALVQGPRSMLEYQQQFEALYYFAPEHMNTDRAKAKKFIKGLRSSIGAIAKSIEDKQREGYQIQVARKAKATGTGRQLGKFVKGATSTAIVPRKTDSGQVCTQSRPATTTTQPLSMRCYVCQQPGHLARSCPQRKPREPNVTSSSASTKKPQVAGKVFALSAEEAETTPGVVTGTILVSIVPTFVLFDSGASHSFVSSHFAMRMGIELKKLAHKLMICTPTGFIVDLEDVYEPCVIQMCGRDMIAHLICIDMKDFDVILGMDWLLAYRDCVLCAEKKIVFRPRDGDDFTFQGHRRDNAKKLLISAIQVQKLLEEGCEAYLACVRDTTKRTATLEELEVVREFPDVFPEDLCSVPPDRETEFCIDLIPGAAPVSRASYRMVPAELKELKEQL
ncbi:uncharacterized protein LOC122062355 [Macadamia integrifolia]|uniref:uncharacterized protein LOC122062355 n=1 Tax=Macadamia integrifolia TaxID=60698 RepID=UPI001C4F9DD1|nr:uncharacterized protein LOC122062355 [Macadamia integrifolia]